jgi:pimeloyl-ACP methyl ester carboxylesterase
VKIKSWVFLGAAAGGTAFLLAVRRYHRQLFEAYRRISAASRLIDTSKGPLEFAETGSGPAVLISAGMGGYDLGLQFAFEDSGFRYISVSRPGYLRTPLFTGRSFEEQADAFAALLDHLGIQKAAVVGISSGGPAAIQFALRHPDRCWSLVLISAPNQPLPPTTMVRKLFNSRLLTSDFLAWLVFKPVHLNILFG